MGEIKRLINRKVIYIIIISLILCVLCYILKSAGTDGVREYLADNNIYNGAINSLSQKDIQTADKYIENLKENGKKNISDELTDYMNYINGYGEFIEKTLLNAEKSQQFSIFNKADDYTMRNINKIYKDYIKLRKVKPQIVNQRAFISYGNNIALISMFVIFIILYMLFNMQKEYDNREILFSYSAPKGRFALAVRRNIIITITAIILTIAFNLVIYILSNMLYGYVDYTAPVQSVSSYSKCSMNISIITELFLNVLETGIGLALIAMLTNLVFNIMYNKYISICFLGGLFFIEWRAALLVQNNSVNRILANINLYRIIDYSTYHKNYQNINIFNYPISSHILIFTITLVLFVAFFLLSALTYAKRYPYRKQFFAKVKNNIEIMAGKFCCKLGFVYFELYKLLIRGKKLFIIIAFILAEIILIYGTRVDFPARQRQMDRIYEEYGGGDWERFNGYVQNYENEISQAEAYIEDIKGVSADEENAHNIFMEAESLNSDLNEKRKILSEYKHITERKERIEADKGLVVYAMSDRGYDEIYGSNSYIREAGIIIMLIVITVIISSGYYIEEEQSGVDRLIKCSVSGIAKVYNMKLCILSAVITGVSALFIFMDMFFMAKLYGFKYINAPLVSITFMESRAGIIFANMKIWQYIILDIITKLSVIIISMFTALELSFKTRNLFYAPAVILLMSIAGVFSIYAYVYIKFFIILLAVVIMWGYIFLHRSCKEWGK